jgi:hypothetical protein
MTEEWSPRSESEPLARLDHVARIVQASHHMSADAKHLVAELVAELATLHQSNQSKDDGTSRLVDHMAQLLQVMTKDPEPGMISEARLKLEQALFNAETHAPTLVGVVRRVLEALVASGI